ncbi:MAG TPA: hypothetical protein VHO70_20005 [Chitinispirillaceae bacterium]|nr:hypothetical protein [Chitinispirillaceae bacterium]
MIVENWKKNLGVALQNAYPASGLERDSLVRFTGGSLSLIKKKLKKCQGGKSSPRFSPAQSSRSSATPSVLK